jgi:hypothetical protein
MGVRITAYEVADVDESGGGPSAILGDGSDGWIDFAGESGHDYSMVKLHTL